MLPIEDLNLKFTLSAYLWEMKILNKALPPSLVAKNIFRKKQKNKDIFIKATTMMLIIMIITIDLTSSYSSSSIREIKLNDIFLTESPDLSNALIQ